MRPFRPNHLAYEDFYVTYVGGPAAEGNAHQHAMSRLAEQMVSNMLNLYWDPYKESDPGYDLVMGDITIDVKIALVPLGMECHLPVKRDKYIADIYILVKGKEPDYLEVVGFVSGMKCRRYPIWDKTSGPPAHWVPESACTEMTWFYDKVYEMWPKRFTAYVEEAFP